jgi:integration host factor subunit beta
LYNSLSADRIFRMTRSELIASLAYQFPQLTRNDVSISLSVILNAIGDNLARGGRAEIRGFGSFKVKVRPKKIGRNPKTGEIVPIPAKAAPHFRPGRELKVLVNASDPKEDAALMG